MPVTSEGSRSGVNWTRLKSAFDAASAERLDRAGLGHAGQAFHEDVAIGEEGDEQAFDHRFLADDGRGSWQRRFVENGFAGIAWHHVMHQCMVIAQRKGPHPVGTDAARIGDFTRSGTASYLSPAPLVIASITC